MAYQWDIHIPGRREADQRDAIALLRQDSRYKHPTDDCLEGVHTEFTPSDTYRESLSCGQYKCHPDSTVLQISLNMMGHRKQMISEETAS